MSNKLLKVNFMFQKYWTTVKNIECIFNTMHDKKGNKKEMACLDSISWTIFDIFL